MAEKEFNLTWKQKLFADYYVGEARFNATKAAKLAGYSEKTARQTGSENLSKPVIFDYIQEKLKELTLGANEVLVRLTEIANGKIDDVLDGEGKFDLDLAKERGNSETSRVETFIVMRVHLAGLCSSQSFAWFTKEKLFPKFILESFFYLEDWLFDFPSFNARNFMLDSGAYTFIAQKNRAGSNPDWDVYVERYAETIVSRGIKYFFELDIDNLVGLSEVERLREKLERLTKKKCIPVFHRERGKQYWLDMISAYDYVAIGGIVTKEIKMREHKFLKWFLQTAKEQKTKVHGLGYTNFEGLKKYHFHSVDSTSWVGSKYGILYKFDGRTIKQVRKPENARMKSYKLFDVHNMKTWIKFQKYAEQSL